MYHSQRNPVEIIQMLTQLVKSGKLVLLPSQTGWWMVADSWHKEALAQLMAALQAVGERELVIHIEAIGILQNYVSQVPDIAWDWMEMSERTLWMGFDTFRGLASQIESMGMRCWLCLNRELLWQQILRRLGHALVGACLVTLPTTALLTEWQLVHLDSLQLPERQYLPDKVRLAYDGSIKQLIVGKNL